MSTPPPGWNPQQQPFQQPAPPGYPPQYAPPAGGYPPVGYQPYGYGPQLRTNGLAVTSMVLGIVGLLLFCIYAIPCILAVVFGAVALKQFREQPNVFSGRGMAVAGLVMGIVGTALFALILAAGSTRWTINR